MNCVCRVQHNVVAVHAILRGFTSLFVQSSRLDALECVTSCCKLLWHV